MSSSVPHWSLAQPRALLPGADPHFHRLQRKLLPLQAFQRVTVKYTPSSPVDKLVSILALPPHWYFDRWKMVPFWQIVWGHGRKRSAWLSKAVGKDLPSEKRKALRLSVYMNLKCTFSSCTLRALVTDVLQDDASFSHVEEWRVQPRPRHLLFDLTTEPLKYYTHDVLIVRMVDGNAYVIDVSGPQFGYERFFFGLLEYTTNFVSIDLPWPHKHNTKYLEESGDVDYVIQLAKEYREQWQRTHLKDTWSTVELLPTQEWEALSKDFVSGWKELVCARLRQAGTREDLPFFPTKVL